LHQIAGLEGKTRRKSPKKLLTLVSWQSFLVRRIIERAIYKP
jgi:hypothetical protein